MTSKDRTLLAIATDIQAIAQIGLSYAKDNFDLGRYQQLQRIAAELLSATNDQAKINLLHQQFAVDAGYATPKIDVRAFIRKEDKILLVQEAQDGQWSLPGGWADVNLSPSENIIKEVQEETGLVCTVNRLMALWDTAKHGHPPQWPYIYKCVFDCCVEEGAFKFDEEILAAAYFKQTDLPALSPSRITRLQLEKLIKMQDAANTCTLFD